MVGAVAEQQPTLEMAAEDGPPAAFGGKVAGFVEQDELVRLGADELDVPVATGVEAVDRPMGLMHPPREGERVEYGLGQDAKNGSPRLPGTGKLAATRGELAAERRGFSLCYGFKTGRSRGLFGWEPTQAAAPAPPLTTGVDSGRRPPIDGGSEAAHDDLVLPKVARLRGAHGYAPCPRSVLDRLYGGCRQR